MEKINLSVFLISKNEEERIEKTLKALVGWVDEVIVVDDFSEDNTKKIAEKLGCRVVEHKFEGYGQQKVFAESLCKNKWILNLDCDEVITSDLRDEIISLFKSKNLEKFYAYRFRIVNTFMNEKKPKKYAYYYNQTRLYNKEKAGFRNSKTHDAVIVDGLKEYSSEEKKVVGQLKGIVEHYFMLSFGHFAEKIDRYAIMQANESFSKGKKVNRINLFFISPFAFLKAYIFRRYFLYGINGFIYSKLYSNMRFLKYVKLIELNQNKIKKENNL